MKFADEHHRQRVRAIEGTGGYGAGLTRFLAVHAEQVVELGRPKRAARRHGAKSDPLDASRAAREVASHDQLAQPRAPDRGRRCRYGWPLAARRSRPLGTPQHQLHALVIAAPEALPGRLQDCSTCQLVAACARLRIRSDWDFETATTAATLRSLARRIREHREIKRCLVRYVARQLYRHLEAQPSVDATQERL